MAKILIVDDELSNLESLGKILRNEGHETFLAETGEQAIEMLKNESQINLILTDLKMQGTDGIGVLKQAKKNGPRGRDYNDDSLWHY